MTEHAPRFQFSLADIFAALVSLALPAALLTQIDLDALDYPERLFVAIFAGLFLGLLSAVQYRRAWNSLSVWFVPPFMLFAWSLFLLPYSQLGWPTLAMVIYVIAFLSTAMLLHNRKTGGPHSIAVWALGVLIGFVLSAIFSPGFPSRRLAMNEGMASNTLKVLAEAQEIYHRTDYDGDGVKEYSGTLSGLFETKPGTGDLMLIDRIVADADATLKSPTPRSGYFFLLLKAQGANATGGAKSYLDAKGNLTGGYAFIAFPAKYKKSGFSTFLISSTGSIREKDLGPQTETIVKALTTFDPDASWGPSE